MEVLKLEAFITLAGLCVLLFTLGACSSVREGPEYDYSAYYEDYDATLSSGAGGSPMAMTGLPY